MRNQYSIATAADRVTRAVSLSVARRRAEWVLITGLNSGAAWKYRPVRIATSVLDAGVNIASRRE
jgi:hypothetical protein